VLAKIQERIISSVICTLFVSASLLSAASVEAQTVDKDGDTATGI
jgi:hypothetical protein